MLNNFRLMKVVLTSQREVFSLHRLTSFRCTQAILRWHQRSGLCAVSQPCHHFSCTAYEAAHRFKKSQLGFYSILTSCWFNNPTHTLFFFNLFSYKHLRLQAASRTVSKLMKKRSLNKETCASPIQPQKNPAEGGVEKSTLL